MILKFNNLTLKCYRAGYEKKQPEFQDKCNELYRILFSFI